MLPDPIEKCIRNTKDVLAAYPRKFRTEVHPVLDAVVESHHAMHLTYQDASDYASKQSDILRASDEYLDGLAEDRGSVRAINEDDESYRERTIAWKSVVTPASILATVNAILSPFVGPCAQLFETILDAWFVGDESCEWMCPVGPADTLNGPSYPIRLYPDDAAINGGVFRPQSDPGEALVSSDDTKRMFVLRVPELDTSGVPIPDEVYQAIINSVNRIIGQSIQWAMWVDPRLK